MTKSEQILQRLRAEVESISTAIDGTKWGQVYLDNCRPNNMSDKSFRSCLATLSRQGLYQPQDGYAFGDVRLEAGR
jgi:hypothetical protein